MNRKLWQRRIAGQVGAALRKARREGYPEYSVPACMDAADRVLILMEALLQQELTDEKAISVRVVEPSPKTQAVMDESIARALRNN